MMIQQAQPREVLNYLSQYKCSGESKRFLQKKIVESNSPVKPGDELIKPYIDAEISDTSAASATGPVETWFIEREIEVKTWLGISASEKNGFRRNAITALLAVFVFCGLIFTETVRHSNPDCTRAMVITVPKIVKPN